MKATDERILMAGNRRIKEVRSRKEFRRATNEQRLRKVNTIKDNYISSMNYSKDKKDSYL